ncbi:MAG: TlpA family protein disulfide reductase [Actinomycetota bacterium]
MGSLRRRTLALAMLVVVLGAACTGRDADGPAADTIAGIATGQVKLSLLVAQSSLIAGGDDFAFGLVTSDGGLLSGGTPEVWVARDRTSPAMGPFRATPFRFRPHEHEHGDEETPHSPLTSFYVATVTVPQPGKWLFAAAIQGQPGGIGTESLTVVPTSGAQHPVGARAKPVETPVAKTATKAKQICTRKPEPDPLHYISLDDALKSGKPTVVTFATPLLCESQICGPVVDEVTAAYHEIGKAKANFIHVEEFLPGPDLEPPAAAFENQSPGFRAWGLQTEPWTFVIDTEGVIRARFEGPVVASQIEAALQPLL